MEHTAEPTTSTTDTDVPVRAPRPNSVPDRAVIARSRALAKGFLRLLDGSGLPSVPVAGFARDLVPHLGNGGAITSLDEMRNVFIDLYLHRAAPAWVASQQARCAQLVGANDFADETVFSVTVSAAVQTLRSMVERVVDGDHAKRSYVDSSLSNAFIDSGRRHRQNEGCASREDWFCRAAGRRDFFDGRPNLLWLADKVTRQLYNFPFRADLERTDPFPVQAWADDLGIEDVETVRRMIQEVITIIATEWPDLYEANIAGPMQFVHERLARPDEGASDRDTVRAGSAAASDAISEFFEARPELVWLAGELVARLDVAVTAELGDDLLPVDAWADELGIDSTAVALMLDEVVAIIAVEWPDLYEARIARPFAAALGHVDAPVLAA